MFTLDILDIALKDESEGIFENLPLDYQCLKTGEKVLGPRQEYQLKKNKNYEGPIPMDFSYAYALTYWKAQGSEWNKVLIFEENFPYDKEIHTKALYTAVTRACEKCVLVLK